MCGGAGGGGGVRLWGRGFDFFKVNRNGRSEGLEIFDRKEWEDKMESLSRKRGR